MELSSKNTKVRTYLPLSDSDILEKSFAESRRNLGTSSVPPPRRVKTTNLNKSSNYHNLSRYETRTSRLETNRTTPIAQTYVTKKATIIQEIEEYLDKTMQKSFTQTINRKVDQVRNNLFTNCVNYLEG